MSGSQSWDIVSGVGMTALAVTALRAMETHRPDALIRDEWAAAFVAAADAPVPLPTRIEDEPDESRASTWASMSTYVGVRARFLDEWLSGAVGSGVDQVVVLGAGLDARAFRLDWPAGCELYEVDQPKVLEFKDSVLAGCGAQPRCRRCIVGADLSDDWPAALIDAGFDRARPAVWLAEGVLFYLPAEVEREVLGRIDALSADGSWLGIEHVDSALDANGADINEAGRVVEVDVSQLLHTEGKDNPKRVLTDQGWAVEAAVVADVARGYQRELDGAAATMAAHSVLFTARR